MSHKVNLVRVLTAATGNSTPITLGAAYSQLFMLPSEAGAMDGRVYTYLIVDGNNWELGRGVYTASGTTLGRTTVIASRVSGTLGTSRITLSGTAQVRFIESAEDMDGVRGTRAVTSVTDTLNNSDLGFAVTYSNASAVAVSLAQPSVSNLFMDGWGVWTQNLGAGSVTITPATSTINGAATLLLAQNMGAFIWSDGTNYHAYFIPVTKPLLAGNNLSDLASASAARTNLGLGGAAALNVGTIANTVAAGDDARIVGANILINSDFRINQRGYVSGTPASAGAYVHDRWKAGGAGVTYTFTQLASSTQITITAGGIIQVVEAKNVSGGSYILSWTGTAQARVGVNTATPSGSVVSSPIAITGQTAGTVMSVEFSTGTVGTVKLERGAIATPFVSQNYAVELTACKRHLRLVSPEGGLQPANATTLNCTIRHDGMYAAPTVSMLAPLATTDSVSTIPVQSSASVSITGTNTADFSVCSFGNFSGLTIYHPYLVYPAANYVKLEAEL